MCFPSPPPPDGRRWPRAPSTPDFPNPWKPSTCCCCCCSAAKSRRKDVNCPNWLDPSSSFSSCEKLPPSQPFRDLLSLSSSRGELQDDAVKSLAPTAHSLTHSQGFLLPFLPDVASSSMNTSTFLRRVTTQPAQWTCTSCRGSRRPASQLATSRPFTSRGYGAHGKRFSSSSSPSSNTARPSAPGHGAVLLFASVGAVGASVAAVADDVKATYEGAERAGRVASALFICINEYVRPSTFRAIS